MTQIPTLPFNRLKLLAALVHGTSRPWNWQASKRRYYNLWIGLEGHGTLECDDQSIEVGPNYALLLHPRSRVSGHSDVPVRNFSAHWLPLPMSEQAWELPQIAIRINEVDTAHALIQGLIRLSIFQDPLARQQSEWMLLQLLALVWREYHSPRESAADNIIYRQIERIRSGQDLFTSVDELSREANLSRIHYSRCFRRIANEPPNRFLIRQRIERACILLRNSNWTIETIAETIGYSDVYFFSRQFRQVMHTTPRKFRHEQA
ncbi:helix-turn-helix transcriptional regulator [Coraliomargarita parva]|uniref:helix-turn-helix transcriptional regulator n=1 Tax=Coraliomargarita parva TaxID=3014050 RepID=UPI0022B49590|nr:response regulator transcription factor [Coraliomargarita parva]